MTGTRPASVPELFAAVAARVPDAPAVVHKDTSLGYRQLDEQANRLARELIRHGVGPDRLVAVAVPRSAQLVVVLLAVLKAGGAYLPLDPGYPAARLSYLVEDAAPVLLVRAGEVALPAADLPEIVVDDPEFTARCARHSGAAVTADELRRPLLPDHLMYVIYTSGSTGSPKGVLVSHEGVRDLVATQTERFGPVPGERVLQWASVSFDAFFWDLTLALLSGATLVMADADDLLPGENLHETLVKYDITHAVLPPVALSITDSDGVLPGGTIMSTGDACTPTLIAKWAPGRRMFNGYGPTEVTVGVSIAGPVEDPSDTAVGRPWTGGRVHVLDERLRPVPDGEEGELYLAGSGLARGYLKRPGLTATRFVPDPFGPPGTRMYRSGDRGWRGPAGELHFAGRADDQVKVRGFRIELGEIETCLTRHPAVQIAACVVTGALADARVVAFTTLRPGAGAGSGELREFLAASLPEHMVPARIAVLPALPTLSNGKIDRRALRDRADAERTGATAAPAAAPAGLPHSHEEALYATVRELLALDSVDPGDNLFRIGGNSVVAARLVSVLRKKTGVRLPMRAVFEAETLAGLARLLHEHDTAAPGERR
ncbi:amino acid adenylation domain-containing protein [Streptomyces sp. NPDC094038]|uniref:non-ribosomal peptide synthetase n=1 Tax=Streptomyces sp. NPDC094038 TaxID=3366055 RepID=UPI003819F484